MREIVYAVEGKAANLKTFAIDEPGHGGACHKYHITKAQGDAENSSPAGLVLAEIEFQNGPINADGNGVNGVQHEDLLAIIIDRLEGFQSGPYACVSNAHALDMCRGALIALQNRTRERMSRGVEGTHKV